MKKVETEKIIKKLKFVSWYNDVFIKKYINNIDVTEEQFDILTDHENWYVRKLIIEHPNFPKYLLPKMVTDEHWWVRFQILEKSPDLHVYLIILLGCDKVSEQRDRAIEELEKLSNLDLEELEKAYDSILASRYVCRNNIKRTFDYIIKKFPEISKNARIFKTILLRSIKK